MLTLIGLTIRMKVKMQIIKSLVYYLTLLVVVIAPNHVAADNKFYIQFNGGAAFTESSNSKTEQLCSGILPFGCFNYKTKESYDTGFMAGMALGYRIADQFRLEAEGFFNPTTGIKRASVY